MFVSSQRMRLSFVTGFDVDIPTRYRKIRENEQLHRSKIELRDKYEHDVGKLKTLLAAANKARDIASAAAEEAKQSLAEDRARLQGESSTLSEELSKLRDESAVEIRRLELQLNSTEVALETALKTAAGKLYFDDTTKCEFNEFNVPSFDPQRAPRIKEFHVQMLEHVRKFCGNFSNLLTYFEEAAATGAERGYKPLPVSYTRVLDGHATFIKPLERYSLLLFLLLLMNVRPSEAFWLMPLYRRYPQLRHQVCSSSNIQRSPLAALLHRIVTERSFLNHSTSLFRAHFWHISDDFLNSFRQCTYFICS